MLNFSQLKKNLKKPVDGVKTVRLAVLGDSATQFVVQAIRGFGLQAVDDQPFDAGGIPLNIEIFEAEFNQIDRQILDPSSELYEFQPEATLLFQSSHKLLQKYNKQSVEDRVHFAEKALEHIQQLVSVLQGRMSSKIILCNFTEEDDRVFGQYANKVSSSFIFQIRKLNVLLQEWAAQTGNLFICDLSTIQNTIGREKFWSPDIYTNTEMVVSIDALPYLAQSVVQILSAFCGSFKKCVMAWG
jgi:predicted enzyme involved in methoxymalonyl-ACP biosynthesis